MHCKDLKATTYRHLRHDPYCFKCGEYIELDDEIEYNKVRQGHRVKYHFYHKECAERWLRENG